MASVGKCVLCGVLARLLRRLKMQQITVIYNGERHFCGSWLEASRYIFRGILWQFEKECWNALQV